MFTRSTLRSGVAALGCAVLISVLAGCTRTNAPTVSSTTPADEAVGVAVNANLSATFSMAMDPATIDTTTFTLSNGATPVPGVVTYSGVTATFNPTSNLLPNTLYTARITTGAEAPLGANKTRSGGDDDPDFLNKPDNNIAGVGLIGILIAILMGGGGNGQQGGPLAEDYVWTFTTGGVSDTIAPTVISTTPVTGGTGVALGGNLSATFSEVMDPSTINTQTFTLSLGNVPISGTVTYAGVTATFNPTLPLAPNTIYSARITTGAEDLAGNALTSSHTWTFTTGTNTDDTAPTVISTVPADGATGVLLGINLSATFSEAMNPSTINTATFTLDLGILPITGTVTYVGASAIFNPTTPLVPNTTYTAMITTGATDLAGNALANDYVWQFTTAGLPDSTAPMVSSTVPVDGAVGVALNGNLSATFTEAMNPSTINTTTFTLENGNTPIAGVVTYAGITAVFNPATALASNTVYTATIHMEVEDLAGNNMATDYEWTFTTSAVVDGSTPEVSSTTPVNGSLDVAINTNLSATFSEAMDPLTINETTFTLRQGTTPVLGTVTYTGVTATFTPVGDLQPNSPYIATIMMEATDLAGNPMAMDFTWVFTTGAAPDNEPPTVSSTDPERGETGVALNTNVAATFSEAMNPLTITTANFTLTQGTTQIPGTVTYIGVTAIFNPTSPLAPNTTYTATIIAAEDLAGNRILNGYAWIFTTGAAPDTSAPMVSSTNPANGAINVPRNKIISATFTEAMDPLTINTLNFTLSEGTTPILGTVTYSGVTALFTPIANLESGTTYTATIWMESEDLAGNQMLSDYEWTFTTSAAPDTTSPLVSSTAPANGALGVSRSGNLAATFSEAMNPLTITTSTFALRQGLTTVPGTVTYSGVTAVFNPTSPLASNTVYTATITTGARDLAGNNLDANYVWNFTTGAGSDITAPMVSSTAPANGAIGVQLGRNISATFSEAMNPLTITSATFTLDNGTTLVSGTVSYSGVTAVLNPTSPLAADTAYIATITTEVQDLAGNPMLVDYMWTFTTGATADTTSPTVSSTDPSNGASDVPLNMNISATFSEAMDPLTINTLSFTLDNGVTPVIGTVSYAGVTATFNPSVALAPNTFYTATVWTEATDLAGNPMLGDYVWTFTTGAAADATAPTVSSTVPANGAIGVSLNNNLSATFSEAMNPLTINSATFTLDNGTTLVSGTVTYSGVTAVLNPTSALAPNTVYIATITNEVGDLAGNTMLVDHVWTFTTGASAETLAPMVSSTVPANGAIGVSLNNNLSATFSEAMNPLTINSATFTLDNGTTLVSGTVTYTGITAVLNPTSPLAPNTVYFATITNAVEDLAGNTMLVDYLWTFTTGTNAETTAPMVSSTVPFNGRIGYSINGNISATFSEAMNPLTINSTTFTLDNGTTLVSGTVTYSGVTAVLNPTSALAPNTVYIATITNVVEDLAGNTMLVDYVWTFTTGTTPDTSAPMVSSTTPAHGDINTSLGANLSATFSEEMDPLTINTTTFTLNQGLTQIPGSVTYSGVTAVFNPSTPLAPNTVYTATIWMEASDLAGNQMLSDYVWTITTGTTPDVTAPIVSSTVPFNGRIGYPISGNISATFSEAMNPLTINSATFTLDNGTTLVSGTVTYSGVTAVLNPTTALAPNTVYIATITDVVEDLAGNNMLVDYVWTFTTGAAADISAPMVSSTVPFNGRTGYPIGANLSATFSEEMNPLTITSATFTLDNGTTLVSGTVTYSGVTAVLNPTSALAPNTLYFATITNEVEDLAGNTMLVDYVWSFTTGAAADITAPMVSSTTPVDGANGVPLNKKVGVTFSEAMDPLTINTLTFTLDDGVNPVLGTVTYAGVTATFTPVIDLLPNTTYTAAVWMEASDLTGNMMESDYVWTFTTGDIPDADAPTVLSTDPLNAAIGVPINTQISATFSEEMNPLTINTTSFTLRQGTTPVIGTVSYVGVTATFTPVDDLVDNMLYTATITTEAEDLAGNPMLLDYVWTFTTGDAPDIGAPTVISTDPIDGAFGVPINKKISAVFSEALDPLTINTLSFTVFQGLTEVLGTVVYLDDTATFTPATNLVANLTYTATVTSDVTDLAGNPMASDYVWTFDTGITTAQDTINLRSAGNFAILAGSTVTNTGPSIVTGDLGVSPGTAVVGFPPGIVLNGAMYTGVGSAAGQAKLDLTMAFNEAAARSNGPVSLPGDLSGLTLYPGLYTNSTTVMLSAGNVTLDAQGDENAVFIFQIGSTLTTGTGTQVVLAGGAKAANIYWQVGTSATLGTFSIFKGNILAQEAITLATGASLVEGRALTQTAAVSLDAATITVPAP